MFHSNAEMVRYHLNKLLSDGKEHSMGEIKAYIREATEGKSVTGEPLTDPTISSAAYAIMRVEYPRLQQPRRGYFQRKTIAKAATAEELLLKRAKDIFLNSKDRLRKVYTMDFEIPGFFESLPKLQQDAWYLTKLIRDALEYIDRELEQYATEELQEDEEQEQNQAPIQEM